MDKIKFYGTMWCSDCHRSKEFLDTNKIDYEYTDVDENQEFAKYITKINNGLQRVPTIIFPDGSILVEPTNQQLADKLRIS
ncbi:MAG: NrdH-redoxin [SAR202 cluster bacterium]|nr:NrdH-redoxin [SAR202 cluster bacterium]|tara:strand:- start:245 stop:487 length:243 start_codon:yes stop_codon:yes gene_type:complete